MKTFIEGPLAELPWLLAVILAIGGTGWGLFLLSGGPIALILPPFTAGYLVTIGYVCRALSQPHLEVRRGIWVASLLVQGAWMLLLGIPSLLECGPNSFAVWWAFATTASVAGLLLEPWVPPVPALHRPLPTTFRLPEDADTNEQSIHVTASMSARFAS